MLLKPLLMGESQGHMSLFHACVTQQEDTMVHSRTWDLFISKVGRWWWWERLKRNLKFLTQHHLHYWVRKEIHMHVTWEETRKVKLKVRRELCPGTMAVVLGLGTVFWRRWLKNSMATQLLGKWSLESLGVGSYF